MTLFRARKISSKDNHTSVNSPLNHLGGVRRIESEKKEGRLEKYYFYKIRLFPTLSPGHVAQLISTARPNGIFQFGIFFNFVRPNCGTYIFPARGDLPNTAAAASWCRSLSCRGWPPVSLLKCHTDGHLVPFIPFKWIWGGECAWLTKRRVRNGEFEDRYCWQIEGA